jgi:ferredoxin
LPEASTARNEFRVVLVLPSGEREISVAAGEHIWDAALAAGIRLPAMCHQGRCLTCAAQLEGPGCVDQSDSNTYFPQDREEGFVLPCTGKPCSDLRLRTHQQDEMRAFRREHGLPAPYS